MVGMGRCIRMLARAPMRGMAIACLLLGFAMPCSMAAEARMETDRDVVEQGEAFILSLVIRGAQAGGQFNNLPIPGLQLRYLGAVNQIENIHGQSSMQVLHRFLATPEGTNDIAIPRFNIQLGNQTLVTEPLVVRVVPREAHDEPVWIKLLVDRDSAVVGETFPIEAQLYFKSVKDVSTPRLDLDGFVLGKAAEPRQAATVRGGEQWSVLSWRFAVTASKAGDLKIGPAEADLTLLTEVQRQAGNVFDDFFGPPRKAKRMTVKAPARTLRVSYPPAARRPSGFAGVVGRFRMSGSFSPERVHVGDPVTVKVVVQGEGGIEGMELPPWPDTPTLRVYPGTNGFAASDPLGLAGTRTLEFVIVPERAGKVRLPVPSLVSYDPAAREYRTATAGEMILEVLDAPPTAPQPSNGAVGAGAACLGGTNGAAAGESPGAAWRASKGAMRPAGGRWGRDGWIAWLAASPWLGWAAVLGARALKQRLANRPQPVFRGAWRERMHEARRFVEAGTDDLGACGELVRCRLGTWLDRDPGTINRDVALRALMDRGMDQSMAAEVGQWFDAWESRRFAPGRHGADESFRGETLRVVARIERAMQGMGEGK